MKQETKQAKTTDKIDKIITEQAPRKKVGRPLLFKNKKELEDRIDKYWEYCAKENKPLTMSKLAVYLGTNRQTLLNYSKKEQYFDTIKKARAMIEAYIEEGLLGKKLNVVGCIFNLKNNFNWRDKYEQAITKDEPKSVDFEI